MATRRKIGSILNMGGSIQAVPVGSAARPFDSDGKARDFFRAMQGVLPPSSVGATAHVLVPSRVEFAVNEATGTTDVFAIAP